MMEERLTLMERKLVDFEDGMARITSQLAGDGSDLAPGVIGILASHTDQLNDQKGRLNRLERSVDRFRWTLAGAAGVGGLLGGGIVAILTQNLPDVLN